MDLYLHIGTEKTGSSYLQSLAAKNRENLSRASIHFPSAGARDKQMLRGEISAGNAQSLTNALDENNWSAAEMLLKGWSEETRVRNCQKLLLSNELLVLALAHQSRLKHFEELITSVGFHETQVLLLLRDPADQALSLYRHRAKAGTAPSIEDWPEDRYHYGLGLQQFLQAVKNSSLSLSVRKYRKKGLEDVFFSDWLGEALKVKQPKQVVNPSLSLSELLLIRQLRQNDVWLPRFLYERLLSLPKSQKDPEPKLNQYYRNVLNSHISQFETTWQLCNQYLPENEKLDIPQKGEDNIKAEENVLTFSPMQGKVIAHFMKEAASSIFQWKVRYRKYRYKLGRIKNSLLRW